MLAAIDAERLPPEWRPLVTAANDTLTAIGHPLLRRNAREILLRGSDASSTTKEELLRAQAVGSDTIARELLRTTVDETVNTVVPLNSYRSQDG
jgi:hypothetical protein